MTLPALMALALVASPLATVDYPREIKPVLARRCVACHGALKQEGGLRVDTAALMLRGGESGPAIEPGQSDQSLLVEKLTGAGGLRMPPEGEPLSAKELELVRGWIDQGAHAPEEKPQPDPRDHWSFRPPTRPEVPGVSGPGEIRNPVDAFLASGMEKAGLTPAPEADRGELLRRVSLDLTGLAPSPSERSAFLADPAPDAYEKAVDRLLASPHYGERWGRHWMDIWRYSDWAGYKAEVRESQPHIWRWRDWIVESLNDDKGYDRMILEMLAADEAAPDDESALRATGFLARNWSKFSRDTTLQNTVDHSARAFLGLTFACARCHDHKYDPISQTEYYRLRAFFEPQEVRADRRPGQADLTKDALARVYDANPDTPTFLYARGDEKSPDKDHPLSPGLPAFLGGPVAIEPVKLPLTAFYPGMKSFVQAEATDAAETSLASARAAHDKALLTGPRVDADAALAEKLLAAALWERESTRLRIAADRAEYAEPRDAKAAEQAAAEALKVERQATLRRAEATLAEAEMAQQLAAKPDEKARADAKAAKAREAMYAAGTAAVNPTGRYTSFGPIYPRTSTGRRLALARRIGDRANPLTARVAINHIWLRHFGRPLVGTPADFGLNGRAPSHPELLDWLAVEFMERGWSMKAIHRLLVTSDAYRRVSTGAGHDAASVDPDNSKYWRMNPRRMESEIVRDNVLLASGTLDPARGGPDLDPDAWLTSKRRSLYFRHAAEKQVSFLAIFDAPNVSSCYRRDESVVPQQALAMANSPLVLAASRRLAADLSRSIAPDADDAFVRSAFERTLGRGPTDEERAACVDHLTRLARSLESPADLKPIDGGAACEVAPAADPRQRAREGLVHVLLNHNDFLTIR
ncbi:PSD1 and planctomycete cytochrome C domain-containing protein [Tundrisphaera sp. TA3]|uniref:PSD1 and planctomycete cytochrome C domain-containing protein n=1 Tax=Tundrisphaera sp. TA3 TaxID=3435775 RepID=UPI003EBBDFFA